MSKDHGTEQKVLQKNVKIRDVDPERMTLDEDGQEAFDEMWEEGDAPGYLERPIIP